jgi:sugar (pentulose or hexulose) kinase
MKDERCRMKDQLIEPGTGHVGTAAPGCPVEQSSTGLASAIAQAMLLLVSALREIFDEAAYARFLDRRHLVSSRAAYAAFRQEYEAAKARRPRCC